MTFLKKHILPYFVAAFYWVWSHLWRMKVIEHPELTKIKKTTRVIFCHWHGDELVVIRLGPPYHCAAMTSTSKDGELMDKVLNILGFGTSRGSSTRGGARALIGMIKLMEKGYHATMAVDGPKGPRHKAKPGAWALAKHTGMPIIPMGVARKSALVFNKSWNKTYLPWPLSRVIVTFGAPMYVNDIDENTFCKKLEKELFVERGRAQKILSFLFFILMAVTGCSSAPIEHTSTANTGAESLLARSVHSPMKPRGKMITGTEPAILRFVSKSGIADKLGLKIGDRILKLNGKDISGYAEFEKKLSNVVSPAELVIKSKNLVLTKRVPLADTKNRWGASTEIQGMALIKKTSPGIAFINKYPVTVYCSASISEEKNAFYINLIVDSDSPIIKSAARLTVKSKSGKQFSNGVERIDAPGTSSVLISKNFPLDAAISSGLIIVFSLEKQQFGFEFTR